eukprot:COSAG02_NODE_47418_length_341_cov_0.830579_1_plen_30_part_10
MYSSRCISTDRSALAERPEWAGLAGGICVY